MSLDSLTCPYCNALVNNSSPVVPEGRINCPRCGEPLPPRKASTQPGPTCLSSPPPDVVSARQGPSNRLVAWTVLGAMAGMALIGLIFALSTVDFRHRNNQRGPVVHINKDAIDDPRAVAALAPAELPGLGYLPADSNIVGAVHVAEILQDPVARKFLDRPRPTPIEDALASVEKWTGLKAEALDHVVFGLRLGTGDIPRLCLVVHTRQPYDRAALKDARAIHRSKPSNFRKTPLFHFTIGPISNGLLWCADDRTLVFVVRLDGTREEDLNAIPETPRPGAEGLPRPLVSLLRKRLAKGTTIWLAGHLDNPEILGPLLTSSQVPPEMEQVITSISIFGAGLRFQSGVTLMADLHTTDATAARLLADVLRRQIAPDSKVVSSPNPLSQAEVWAPHVAASYAPAATWSLTAAATLRAAMTAMSRAVPEDEVNWVTLQVRGEADVIRGVLNDLSSIMPRVLRQ